MFFFGCFGATIIFYLECALRTDRRPRQGMFNMQVVPRKFLQHREPNAAYILWELLGLSCSVDVSGMHSGMQFGILTGRHSANLSVCGMLSGKHCGQVKTLLEAAYHLAKSWLKNNHVVYTGVQVVLNPFLAVRSFSSETGWLTKLH